MNKYILIKDEGYSSNLYTNFIEFLDKDDRMKCGFANGRRERIRLMIGDDARTLLGEHALMLDAKHIKADHDTKLSLVSFGGCVYDLPLGKMMVQALTTGSSTLASFAEGNEEGEILAGAKIYSVEDLEALPQSVGYLYLTLVHLQGTDVFYMIVNPTVVSVYGKIEIRGGVNIQQIMGIQDTLKDSIFTMEAKPMQIGNHIISGGLSMIDVLGNSIIYPEDREEFFSQLELGIVYREENAECTIQGTAICLSHTGTTPLIVEVQNKLLGESISDKEKLRWEYIATLNG